MNATQSATAIDYLRENPYSLSRTQRGALIVARDAEDGRVDALSRRSHNVGDGDIVPNRATLAKLVELGLALPIGRPESPVSIEINDAGREIAELIKPFVPRPSKADLLADIVANVIQGGLGIAASRNDIDDIIRLHTEGASITTIADLVCEGWRITTVRKLQDKAIDTAVAIRDTLNDCDI